MSETIIKIIQKLKELEPNDEFKKRSLTLILNAPQNSPRILFKNIFSVFQFSGAMVMASVLIFIVLGGLSILNLRIFSPSVLAGLDAKNLNEEINNLDLQIKLSGVKYYEDPLDKASVALTGNSKSSANQSGDPALETEVKNLNNLDSQDDSLEKLLNELVL